MAFPQAVHHWETLVNETDTWNYFAGNQEPPSNWYANAFDDANWLSGPGGFGYGDGDDNTVINENTIYIRISFNVIDTSNIGLLSLFSDADDAFVAYLNGIEVARENIGTIGIPPTFDAYADNYTEAVMYDGGLPTEHILSKSSLVEGSNVIAIQIHNSEPPSSDLSGRFFLLAGINDNSYSYSATPQWFVYSGPFSSNLPLILIETNWQTIDAETKTTVELKTINNAFTRNSITDTVFEYNGDIQIEIRGSSSASFPKTPYGFTTVDGLGDNLNTQLLGLPAENDWVLNNPWVDKTLMYNVLLFNMANEMGGYAPRSRFCEVFINDDYEGIYVLLEKIKRDKNRVDIKKLKATDNLGDLVTGGYVFKVDKDDSGVDEGWISPYSPPNATFNQDITLLFHSPDGANLTTQQKDYLENHFTAFENALAGPNFADINVGYRNYIDVESFIDFFIINEFAKNIDAYRGSTFLHKDRDSEGGKIVAGPLWDFNLSFGSADYCDGLDTEGWAYEFNDICGDHGQLVPFWWDRLLDDPNYQNQLRCRWEYLRSTVLDTASLFSKIDSMATLLDESQKRNYDHWGNLDETTFLGGHTFDSYAEGIAFFKAWISDRIDWLDTNIPGNGGSCFSTNQIVISEINYNPHDNQTGGDWIEIFNTGNSPIDISHWHFKDGGAFNNYYFPTNTTIDGQGHLVLTNDLNAFQLTHPNVTNVIGDYAFGLGNGSETLQLQDAYGKTVFRFSYNDKMPWPQTADGFGRTMERVFPIETNSNGTSWFAGCIGGSPGTNYSDCTEELIFSEINYHSDSLYDMGDWVELYNNSNAAIDISGYRFFDEDILNSYTIPPGTVIEVGERLVIAENELKFNNLAPTVSNYIGPSAFGLDNSGEVIAIENALGQVVQSVRFNDSNPWPQGGDGDRYTLELSDVNTSQNDGNNWFNGCEGGSPGTEYTTSCPVLTANSEFLDITKNLEAFPNPFSDEVNIIQSNNNEIGHTLTICDMMGKTVFQKTTDGQPFNWNGTDNNGSELPKGIYILSTNNNIEAIRLIKK